MIKNLLGKLKTAGRAGGKNSPLAKLSVNDQQKKVIAIVIAVVVVLGVDVVFILSAQLKSSSAVLSKVLKIRSDLAQYRRDYTGTEKLKKDLAALKERAAYLESNIISDSDLPVFLDNISRKANFYSIKIMQIKPLRLEAQSDKKAKGPVKGGLELYGLPINMQLRAGYHKLGEFLNSLENNPLAEVVNLKICYDSASSAYHSVDLDLKAYVTKK